MAVFSLPENSHRACLANFLLVSVVVVVVFIVVVIVVVVGTYLYSVFDWPKFRSHLKSKKL